MNFIIRSARNSDIEGLYSLSKEFPLLNLPPDKSLIEEKINISKESFLKRQAVHDSKYLFVAEDLELNRVVGCSQIIGKKGTPGAPNHSFEVIKKEKFSPDLCVGFIHQLLRLTLNTDGPTEVGGLVVGRDYRRRPEKIGKALSLLRFVYMGLERSRFMPQTMSEMAPPLTEEGRSEFWEALGRRFTGMPFQEADMLSQKNKGFIKSLFPEEDIYVCLLDGSARLVLGQVSEQTQPALSLLKKMGFEKNNHIDPFDGGPHIQVNTDDIKIIKQGQKLNVKFGQEGYESRAFVGHVINGEFFGAHLSCSISGDTVFLPERAKKPCQLEDGQQVFVSVIN